MNAKNLVAPITDHNYRSDLQRVRTELRQPIIVLFDESNVLAHSRIHLEKLRNIFMNTPGYMLVLTGTSTLFPVIDEVFSPIIRQFKKIEVKEFADKDETAQCIRRPLEKLGIKNLNEIFESETLQDVKEIHSLSGGRPYEIQLICHLLFRRLQAKRAHRMRLTFSVLEDVRRELETSQDISSRPILTKIKGCTNDQLQALQLLCACEGHATFDQVWAIQHSFLNTAGWTKEKLQEELNSFIQSGVLQLKGNVISFCGDYFDRVYTKYFARESGSWVNIVQTPLDEEIEFQFFLLTSDIDDLFLFLQPVKNPADVEATAGLMKKNDPALDIFEEGPHYIQDLYFFMFRNREKQSGKILWVTLELPWLGPHTACFEARGNEDETLAQALKLFEGLGARVREVGGSLTADVRKIPIIPLPVLVEQVKRTANEAMRKAIARTHMEQVLEEHVGNDNIEAALLHAELALEYRVDLSPTQANNIGYLFLLKDELDKAEALLDIVAPDKTLSLVALVRYNSAVLAAKQGRCDHAIKALNECISLCNEEGVDKECACLIGVSHRAGRLYFDEIRMIEHVEEIADEAPDTESEEIGEYVNILEAAQRAKDSIQAFESSSSDRT